MHFLKAGGTMKKHYFLVVIGVLLTQICAAQQTQTQSNEMSFKKVKYVYGKGERKEKDARLIFTNDTVQITDDNEPRKELFVEIPKAIITKLVYEHSSKPRWKAPWTLFSKEKQHWLTIQYGKTEDRQNSVVLRLNNENYQSIVGTIEGETGIQTDMIVAE
ncbi:MAG: hypothetical protein ACRD4B_03990 [Acidobacteriota bacterium]